MKKQIIKTVSLFLSVVFILSGCSLMKATVTTKKVITYPEGKEAQAVLAFNPVFYIDGELVDATEDINGAIVTDAQAKTLTSLSEDTQWKWVSKTEDDWTVRSATSLEPWRNKGNVSNGKLRAYLYSGDGSRSLMCYSTSQYDLKSYNGDAFPETGILMSTSGSDLENLSYVAEYDGDLDIPATTLTMMKTVGGVETGFLDDEDGSVRTAVVNILINETVLWSGEFGKGVGKDGADVTFLETPEFTELSIAAGDVISFGIQLNGEKQKAWKRVAPASKPQKTDKPVFKNEEKKPTEKVKGLSFVDGYNSRFEVVYPEGSSFAIQKLGNKVYTTIEKVTEAESRLKTDDIETYGDSEYEILIGETSRSTSKEVYSNLRGYRKNCANDYIIAVVGKDVVIAGGSETALENAVNFFLDTYLINDKSEVPGDLYIVSRPKVRALTINGTDAANYVIRTERYPSILAKRAANQLSDFFVTQCGISLPVENDQKTTVNEILVGLTERSGVSGDVFKSLSLDYVKGYEAADYNIFFTGNKLFIEAGSDYAANYGVGLIKDYLTKQNDLPATYKKSGKYDDSADETKFALSDGYGLAWTDEFYTSDKNGNSIQNELTNWTDTPAAGSDASDTVCYTPDSDLVKELLANPTDPLYKLLSQEKSDKSHGRYYEFSKISRSGPSNMFYGASDNLLWQKARFDYSTGFSVSRLVTEGVMDFRYGIFETRIMINLENAVSSCVWFHGSSGSEYYPEIDLYENFGGTALTPNLHTWSVTGYHVDHGGKSDFRRIVGRAPDNGKFSDTFHYLGIEWNADYIDFYLDGEIFCTAPMTDQKWDAFEQKVIPELVYGLNGGFYQFSSQYPGYNGGINQVKNFDQEQKYDYVRIFQKKGQKQRVWTYSK